jgi:Fe-S cluster assembly protein SufD
MSATVTDNNTTSELAALLDKQRVATASDAALRKDATDAFRAVGLPAAKAEEYRYTPVTRILEKQFSLSQPTPAGQVSRVKDYAIAGLEADTLVFINGVFSPADSNIQDTTALTILPLQEALATHTALVLKHLGQYADTAADAFTAWNTAAWTNGLFVHVPDNKVVERPIILYHLHDASEGQVVTATRNLIVVGKNAEVTILEKYDSTGASPSFSNQVTEAVVAENAGLNLYSIQHDAGQRYQVGTIRIQQANYSRVNTFTFTLNGKLVRNNLQLVLDGEGIESHMYGLYLLTGDTLADNHTVVDHRKPNSFSNELYKGVMDGTSRGVFNGKIYVRPQAQKTNAFQANRNILLSPTAIVNTKPQLEIWADDVKCSHGCTSGQLDEEAVFYLRSRGIDKLSAQAMMLYAFTGEVLTNVKNPVVKEYLDNLISQRLHKNF